MESYTCPHCGGTLSKWKTPSQSSWGESFQFVCFNDDCSYFLNGWEHMKSNYYAHSSYRHRFDPVSGETGPLPVWSKDALKVNICE